jgi:hypothetical protein
MADANDSSCPDQLVPAQWSARLLPSFFDVPERRLLLAVLSDAVRLLHAGRKGRAEVVAWIRGQPARITFQELCDELAIDAVSAGRHLVRTQEASVISHRRIHTYKQGRRESALCDTPAGHPAIVEDGAEHTIPQAAAAG